MKTQRLWMLAGCLLIAGLACSCSDDDDDDNGTTQPDVTAPEVSLTSPAGGATLSGEITLTAEATDDEGIAYVDFYIDRGIAGTDSIAPHEHVWSTNPVLHAGEHVLQAHAYDPSGNEGISESVVVEVEDPDDIDLRDVLAVAGLGQHNGVVFERLVDLDPGKRYYATGEILIDRDTCIRGHGATLDFESSGHILVQSAFMDTTRFDIEFCLILNGLRPVPPGELGGTIEYFADTEGWVVNNTFYNNGPAAIYLHETRPDLNLQVRNNILFNNSQGIVWHEDQPFVTIVHNNSVGSMSGPNYGEHCGCPEDPVATPVYPGSDDLPVSNLTVNPSFVQTPQPPRIEGDFHLKADSPCIGAADDGGDMGAFPYEGD